MTLRTVTLCCCLLMSVVLGGCASTAPVSLTHVRAFADTSASLGGYGELARRYRDTYAREQPYLAPAADKLARVNDARRRSVYSDFVSIQKAVAVYMQTLSLLAGDARYDLAPHIDDLGAGLQATGDAGLTPRHVAAYTGVTRLLTRMITDGTQNRNVETMVRDGDADVQTLLDAMIVLTRLYAKTFDNEKKTVLGVFEIEMPSAPRNSDRVLMVLAKVHVHDKMAEYALLDKRYNLAASGLTKVARGHQLLRDNLTRLASDDVKLKLVNTTQDLRLTLQQLRSDHD
ncbi:MAG: hypothetical protein M3Y65_04705 [Pseudomonadota bacterium]|nr:hypothetical protein [Pseudomonadota bacterium]